MSTPLTNIFGINFFSAQCCTNTVMFYKKSLFQSLLCLVSDLAQSEYRPVSSLAILNNKSNTFEIHVLSIGSSSWEVVDNWYWAKCLARQRKNVHYISIQFGSCCRSGLVPILKALLTSGCLIW